MKNIPKDFLVKVVDNPTLVRKDLRVSISNGKPLIVVDFFDWRFSNQQNTINRATYLTRYRHSSVCSDVRSLDISTRKVNNSGFKVRLTPHMYRGYLLLELIHPEFDNLNYQPSIICYSLPTCLSKSGGYLNNWEFPGTYKLNIVSLGFNQKYELISESGEDSYTEMSIKIGEVLNSKIKRSSKLEPGYFYCLNNRDLFLCLGKISNAKVYKSTTKRSGISTPDMLFENLGSIWSNVESNIDEGYLIFPIHNTETLDYLKCFIGKSVTLFDLISNIPNNLAESSIFNRWLNIGCVSKVLAKKVLNDSIDIEILSQDPLEITKSAVLSMIKCNKLSLCDNTFPAFAHFAEETINTDSKLFDQMLSILNNRYNYTAKYFCNLVEDMKLETLVELVFENQIHLNEILVYRKVGQYYLNKISEISKFVSGYQSIRPITKEELIRILDWEPKKG